MNTALETEICQVLSCHMVKEISTLQELWGGYGVLKRYQVVGGTMQQVIVKHIQFQKAKNHPRGWNTDRSHLRKLHSYEVETYWYQHYVNELPKGCKVPKLYGSFTIQNEVVLVLEDLQTSGYPVVKSSLNTPGIFAVLKWLANFHAIHLNASPKGLWETGTYWHLATRPDEWKAMAGGPLKKQAQAISRYLKEAQFQTIVHGDAKVANFCFSSDEKSVAAVDFQYVGGGIGVQDVAYFFGSIWTDEECQTFVEPYLDAYFKFLSEAMNANKMGGFAQVEHEWRQLFCVAWTDFTRFLLGWMPSHQKLTPYAMELADQALAYVE